MHYIRNSCNILHSSFEQKAYSQLPSYSMNSAMEIPLIFCHIIKYIDDTYAIKLSRINKYSYASLAQYVNLARCFTMKQLKKNRKFQIRKILIRSLNELKELLVHPSSTKIHELVFDDSINAVIKQYPQNIKKITFGHNMYNQLTDNLPASVTHVTFGKNYNHPTNNLPASVTHVTFGFLYNQLTDNLPASVTHITFGDKYDQPTNKLPASVTHVIFGHNYNQLTNNLPASVTHVTFGWCYNQSTNNLPSLVTHVTFGYNYNQPTNNLSSSITHVTFGYSYNQLTDNLPASVTHVTFGNSYDQPTNNLPKSVIQVTFGYSYNRSLDKLPTSVKEVEICEGWSWRYNVITIPEHVKTVRMKKWCQNTFKYKYGILR
jgi:hypothetical protein